VGTGAGRGTRPAAVLAVRVRRAAGHARRVEAGPAPDAGSRPGRLGGRRAAADRSGRARGPGLAGHRRRARTAFRRGAAPAGAAGDARTRHGAVRPGHPPRPAAGPAPAAAGGRTHRGPRGRPELHPGRGEGAVRGGRDTTAGSGARVAVRADRGLGRGTAAGRAVAGRASGSRPVRGRVLRQRAHGRGIPAGRSARPSARTGPAAAAADQCAGPGQRRTGRPAHRELGRRADLAAARAGQHVRDRAGYAAVLVPLPPAVRRPAAAGVAGQRPGRTARTARRGRRVVRRARVPGRGGPPRPGGRGLGPGRPRAVRPLGRLRAQWARRYRARAPGPVPGRGDRRGCGAGRAEGRG
jgi:hypothetical protein